MCGISGFSGNFNPKILGSMNICLAHRGPDDAGVFWSQQDNIGLAHRRLSIIDLSVLGHQPMWDSTNSFAVVFNGEIYNYRQLREDLQKDNYIFKTNSDTEVLLNLYCRYGEGMLPLLNGIFAFAIWDTRTKILFIARDGVGVKPLYYAENRVGFIFASELKALLCEPSVERVIEPDAIAQYLTYLWCPAPLTPLKGVYKLQPGHALIVQNGSIQKKWKFYELPYNDRMLSLSVNDSISLVEHHVRQAVERQMVADVPVGAFLSGGLDSGAIAKFAQASLGGGKLQCFTVGFEDQQCRSEGFGEDLPYARKLADFLGVDLHVVTAGPEMMNHLQDMTYYLDEPQADPAAINALFISRLAQKLGLKVLLSGAGGDDIFTGYRRHHALSLEKYWDWLPRKMRFGLQRLTQLCPVAHPAGRRLAKAFQYASLEKDERIVSYFFWTSPKLMPLLFSAEFLMSISKGQPAAPLLTSLLCLPGNISPLNRMLFLEGKHFLADHNLNYTDKMGMVAGVEIRVPLLDPDLIALAAHLPEGYKQNGTVGKWIFKKAMEAHLPKEIIYRPKAGFGVPLRRWLHDGLRPMVEELLSARSLRERGIFEPAGVAKLLEMDRTGEIDGAYTIFSIMSIELWCRNFLDANRFHGSDRF